MVLLVSFDGFRYDYLKKTKESGRSTPNFDRLRNNGVEAEYVKNNFITDTFPNHYSIVTGHYEESHGIVGNIFYDPVLNKTFNYSNSTESVWWNNGTTNGRAEPIWITNQKAPQATLSRRRSGVLFWPGGDVELHGSRAAHWKHYNKSIPDKSRIDTVIKWFTDKHQPINLGLLYFSEPDSMGHEVGPNSDKILDLVVELDATVGYLISELENVYLMDNMNIIITSDHGMVEIDNNNVVELKNFLDSSLYELIGESPVFHILPHEGKLFKEITNSRAGPGAPTPDTAIFWKILYVKTIELRPTGVPLNMAVASERPKQISLQTND